MKLGDRVKHVYEDRNGTIARVFPGARRVLWVDWDDVDETTQITSAVTWTAHVEKIR